MDIGRKGSQYRGAYNVDVYSKWLPKRMFLEKSPGKKIFKAEIGALSLDRLKRAWV
jgi:hypothetical protein